MMFRQKRIHVLTVCALGAGALAMSSTLTLAQEKVERVEITGSAIKRTINEETALPVTIIDAKQLRESGITSVEEAMNVISGNQTTQGSGQSVGLFTGGAALANLRGIGSNKTLVLLNGRRLASFAFQVPGVDLNSIPLAVVERIEVLRDGASAIYGTDAIGGVINFITKRDFSTGEISAEMTHPKENGGGESRITLTKGIGSLDKDGWNLWASYDNRNQDAIAAVDRQFGATGVIPGKLNKTSGTTFPGNWTQPSTGVSGNPTLATGCVPPFSLPLASTSCRYDYTAAIDLIPPQNTETITARGNLKLGSHLASLEVLHASNTNVARVAPDPVTGITMNPGTPFFPTTGLPAGFDPAAPISVGWRMVPGGRRTNETDAFSDRVVATLKGSMFTDWDYEAGLFWNQSRATDMITDGYVNATLIKAGVLAGTLNPFATPTTAQQALIDAAKLRATDGTASGSTTGADFRLSGEVGNLPGGKIGVSAGLETRKEKYQNDTVDDVVNNVPSLGRAPFHANGNRDVNAFTLEALVPIHKTFELQLATRTDHYSDFGSTTNPKIGFKFQPVQSFLLRGSYNKGFRAPTLDDLYGPQNITYSANAYDDPLLCPGGVVAAGGIASRDCGQQVQAQIGGNPNLKPEKSKTHTFGVVFQPNRDLQLSVDYWKIELTNTINAFPETAVMGNPVQYANRIFRCNQLSAAVQATLDRCSGLFANSNAIGYIVTLSDNLGVTNTDGLDFGASYLFKTDRFGRFAMTYNGTRVNSYKYQNSPDDPLKENVGVFQDTSPVFKWQHVLNVNHMLGHWSTLLTMRYKSGYVDQNPGGEGNNVSAYTLTDLSTTYTGFKNFALTAGVKNLFDKDPPFSNQGVTFQQGYDPRFTDPTGRAYFLRGSYKF